MYPIRWCIMLVLRILIFIFISRVASLDLSIVKNANNYGPYSVKWYNNGLCRGPRSKNVTHSSAKFVTDEYGTVGYHNTTFIVPTRIEEVKTTVLNVNGAQKNTLWNYKVNKPCQHFSIAALLEKYFEMKNCVVKPGVYVFKTNYTEVSQQFFGKSFFYGDYSFKTTVFSKQGNVICILVNALFFKKAV